MNDRPLLLGVDIGTTKVAAVIAGPDRRPLASASIPHDAQLPADSACAEQDAKLLLDISRRAVRQLPDDLRRSVKAIGVTGQMHGIVLLDKDNNPLSPLITWQDGRCSEDFLKRLNTAAGYQLKTGFGCATLAWFSRNNKLPAGLKNCATIHDLLVARLCGLEKPVTDPTDAASWSLFDLKSLQWDFKAIEALGIPRAILPKVLPCSAMAGKVTKESAEQFGIPASIPVAAAIGDNQASLLGTLTDPENQLAITIGTGAQVSAVLPPSASVPKLPRDCRYDYRPFPGNRFAVVGASLAGGSAWAWLARTVEKWLSDLGQSCPPKEQIYDRLNELGSQAKDTLTIEPNFLGQRYDPEMRGTITGIEMDNFNLPSVARALAKGIVDGLKQMLPAEALAGRTQIIGSGNALRKNPLLQEMVKQVFNLPLEMPPAVEEAALGAAVNAASLVGGEK